MLTPPVIFDIFKAREEFRKNDVSHAQEKTHIREILNFYNECTRRYHIFFIKKKVLVADVISAEQETVWTSCVH